MSSHTWHGSIQHAFADKCMVLDLDAKTCGNQFVGATSAHFPCYATTPSLHHRASYPSRCGRVVQRLSVRLRRSELMIIRQLQRDRAHNYSARIARLHVCQLRCSNCRRQTRRLHRHNSRRSSEWSDRCAVGWLCLQESCTGFFEQKLFVTRMVVRGKNDNMLHPKILTPRVWSVDFDCAGSI